MKQLEHGWQAIFGPEGLVAYGNDVVNILRPDGTTLKLCDGSASGWRGRHVAVSRGTILQSGAYGRDLVLVNVDTGAETRTTIDSAQNPGYWPQVAEINGITVSSVPGQHFKNGQPISTEPGAGLIEDFDGEVILYPVQHEDGSYEFVARSITTLADRRIPGKLQNARLDRLPDGSWVSWSGPGWMCVLAPDGRRFDGPDGEGRGFISEHHGVVYCWTVTNEVWTPLLLKRPLTAWRGTDPAVITREVGPVALTHRETPTGTEVAGYLAGEFKGRLNIETIAHDAPAVVYARPVAPVPRFEIPKRTGDLPAVWILTNNDEVKAPGNACWSERETEDVSVDPRPVAESILTWPLHPGRTLLCDKWSTEQAGGGLAALDLHLKNPALLNDPNRAIEIHCDGVWANPDDPHIVAATEGVKRAKAAGVTPILMAHAVHRPDLLDAQVAHLSTLTDKGGITINARLAGKDPEQFAATLARAVYHWQANPWVTMISLFGWKTAPPEVQTWFSDLCAATSTPKHLPGYKEKPQLAETPVEVKPPVATGQPNTVPVPPATPETGTVGPESGETDAQRIAAGIGTLARIIALLRRQ